MKFQDGFGKMVPETGLEPVRDCSHEILSLGRLPIPPHRLISLIIIPQKIYKVNPKKQKSAENISTLFLHIILSLFKLLCKIIPELVNQPYAEERKGGCKQDTRKNIGRIMHIQIHTGKSDKSRQHHSGNSYVFFLS